MPAVVIPRDRGLPVPVVAGARDATAVVIRARVDAARAEATGVSDSTGRSATTSVAGLATIAVGLRGATVIPAGTAHKATGVRVVTAAETTGAAAVETVATDLTGSAVQAARAVGGRTVTVRPISAETAARVHVTLAPGSAATTAVVIPAPGRGARTGRAGMIASPATDPLRVRSAADPTARATIVPRSVPGRRGAPPTTGRARLPTRPPARRNPNFPRKRKPRNCTVRSVVSCAVFPRAWRTRWRLIWSPRAS